jgi:hypothetical protein
MNRKLKQNELSSHALVLKPIRTRAAKLLVFSFLLSLFAFLSATSQATSLACSSTFLTSHERLDRLGGAFSQAAIWIRSLSPDLVNGRQTPTWQDLNNLELLTKAIRSAKATLQSPEEMAEFTEVVLQFARELDQEPEFKNLATAHRWHQPTNRYKPTEYKLKLEYQKLLGKLNHELPRGARIPIQRLPVDLRRARINQDAREFMAEFEKAFERRFPTTGYKTYAEYEAYLRSSDDPQIKKAIEMLDKGQIEVVIRRPESGRFWIPKVGFQNQFVTGSSKGAYSPEGRLRAEQRLYDIEGVEAYPSQDYELLPKYGTLRPAPESGLFFHGRDSEHYGADFYVLRLADINDRLSFMPNDSLHVGLKEGPVTHWSATFIPWKYRLMMVEFMRESLEKSGAMTPPVPGRWQDLIPYNFRYWETQILGALDLSNVESFQFTSENPPSGAFLLDLLKRNIPIYDARNWPPVKWTPSPEALDEAKAARM